MQAVQIMTEYFYAFLFVLVIGQISMITVSVFLHRTLAHKMVKLNPVVQHSFRFWLWFTTGLDPHVWVVIHRRHHVTSDQPEDPHSPHNEGAWNMILNGPWPLLFKYMDHNPSIFFKHGGGVPLNWMEVHVYKKFPKLGLLSLLAIDVALFGSLGPWVWVGHIIYGHISEVGFLFLAHWWGYRHYNTGDKSHNIVPWGIILAGEELHNNHHLKATSPKFSHKWYEFDLGWTIIKTLCFLKLAELRYQPDT